MGLDKHEGQRSSRAARRAAASGSCAAIREPRLASGFFTPGRGFAPPSAANCCKGRRVFIRSDRHRLGLAAFAAGCAPRRAAGCAGMSKRLHAALAQRVDHRVHQAGHRARDSALAHALGAKRVWSR
jgi:hypothetical protein